MKVLVINCGSSSLKYQLIDMENEGVLAQGLVERIGIEGSILTQKVNGEKYIIEEPMESHKDAIRLVLEALVDENHGVIKNMNEISAVGHRVVHGGEKYSKSVLVNDEVMAYLEECVKLAPLHNRPNIIGIEACKALMPNTPMAVVFDTAFHQTLPEHRYIYPIPYEYYEKYGIRKYGAHGTSHKFVSRRIAEILNKPVEDLKIVNCHIGQGASICAIQNGECVETSMGLSPVAGIPMGSRTGDIDPSVITFIMEKENMTPAEMNTMINKKSGLLGISGISSDNRDIETALAEGNPRAKLALDHYHYAIAAYIARCVTAMNGVDVITFTAGVGERGCETRFEICKQLAYLGVKIDEKANADAFAVEAKISSKDSKVDVYVVPTNEELMIARDTKELVENV